MPEQLMQLRPLFDQDAVDHQIEVLLPVVNLVIAEKNLAESRSVHLHAGVTSVLLDRRGAAENQTPRAAVEHRGANLAGPG